MIQLDQAEKKLIKFCKGHYQEKYPFTGSWIKSLKPVFIDIYGWNPDEDNNYNDYLMCLFNKLMDIHLKISDDQSGHNNQLRSIFNAAFNKSIVRENDLPIERAISELCGIIQCTLVFDNGVARFDL